MTQSPPDDLTDYAVSLTMRQWHTVDAVIDNEISAEVVNLDPRGIVGTARRIREAGWRQIAGWTPTATGSVDWPPDDNNVSVLLTASEWSLVLACLDRWSLVDERLGNDYQAAASRAIANLIAEQTTPQAP